MWQPHGVPVEGGEDSVVRRRRFDPPAMSSRARDPFPMMTLSSRLVRRSLAAATVLTHFFFILSSTAIWSVDHADTPVTNHERESKSCSVKFKDSSMALCHYLAYGKNFGDEIGIVVARTLLENHFQGSTDQVSVINLERQGRDGMKCLFNLGSIFHMIKKGDHIWGTGINPKWQRVIPTNITYHSVRGLLTVKKLLHSKQLSEGEAAALAIGDPGTVIIDLFPDQFQWSDSGTPCFVPHHQDEELFLKHQSVHPGIKDVRMVSVRDTWENVTKKLSTCSSIASSSLHGLVIADNLGIPNRWFQFPGGKTESTEGFFKYQDYFSSVNRFNASPLGNVSGLKDASNYWSPPEPSVLRLRIDAIKTSFPYGLFDCL